MPLVEAAIKGVLLNPKSGVVYKQSLRFAKVIDGERRRWSKNSFIRGFAMKGRTKFFRERFLGKKSTQDCRRQIQRRIRNGNYYRRLFPQLWFLKNGVAHNDIGVWISCLLVNRSLRGWGSHGSITEGVQENFQGEMKSVCKSSKRERKAQFSKREPNFQNYDCWNI